ncbi:MAG: hypothetical protein GY788_11450, partial [bacterium]|nr:hypothetical protein [bacterium]
MPARADDRRVCLNDRTDGPDPARLHEDCELMLDTRLPIAAAITVLFAAVPASADTLSDCFAADTADTVAACTRIIEAEGDVPGAVPAWASDT